MSAVRIREALSEVASGGWDGDGDGKKWNVPGDSK